MQRNWTEHEPSIQLDDQCDESLFFSALRHRPYVSKARRGILAPAHQPPSYPMMPFSQGRSWRPPMTSMLPTPPLSSSYMNSRDDLSLLHRGLATNNDYDHNRQIAPLYGTGTRSTGPSSSPQYLSSHLSTPPSMSNTPFTHYPPAPHTIYISRNPNHTHTRTTEPTYHDGQPGCSGYTAPH